MTTNVENKNAKNKSLLLTSMLKQFVELINSQYDVRMCFYQPGLEPLSLIGKTEQEILTELHNNIIIMLSKFSTSGNISLSNWDFKPFLGFEREELKKISARLVALFPITQLKDQEFSKKSITIEATNYIDDVLDFISQNMLTCYIREYAILLQDFQNFKTTTEKTSETSIITMTSPQTLSNYFRIMYKDNNACYCTIADAIRDNQVQKSAKN